MSKQPKRAIFMTSEQRQSMRDLPRTHRNCLDHTGVARPGKTAHDKAMGTWAPHHVRRLRKTEKQNKIRGT